MARRDKARCWTRAEAERQQRQTGDRDRTETETGQADWSDMERDTHQTRGDGLGWAGLGLVSVSTWQTWLAGKLAGERVDEYLHKAGSLSGLA